jgi:hypothetical protein
MLPPDLADWDIKVPTGSLPLGNDEPNVNNKAKVFCYSRIVRESPSAAISAWLCQTQIAYPHQFAKL